MPWEAALVLLRTDLAALEARLTGKLNQQIPETVNAAVVKAIEEKKPSSEVPSIDLEQVRQEVQEVMQQGKQMIEDVTKHKADTGKTMEDTKQRRVHKQGRKKNDSRRSKPKRRRKDMEIKREKIRRNT